ncbi:hypothetical protein ACB092_02G237500 [Castanea dentata]
MDAKTAFLRNIIIPMLLLLFLLSTMVVAEPNNVFPVPPAKKKSSPRNIFVQIKALYPPPHLQSPNPHAYIPPEPAK